MRFLTIRIDGFGCLKDISFQFAPGLNILYGPNEAGKSTLQQAMWAMLYGFFRGERRKKEENELFERYRPWSGGSYGGQLAYCLDSGKSFRIQRGFDDDRFITCVSEADTGREITSDFDRGKHGRVAFAREHFGMSEEVFVNTCFVRQADLRRLESAASEISETVVNLSGTGSQDRSVRRALESLDLALREQVGTDRSRVTPLPSARSRLAQLEDEREDALARRRVLEGEFERRALALEDKVHLEREIARLSYLLVELERNALADRIRRMQILDDQKASIETGLAALSALANFPLEQREPITRAHQRWLVSGEYLAGLTGELRAGLADVESLQRKRQRVLADLLAVEAARDTPAHREGEIRSLEQQWRGHLEATRSANSALDAARVKLEALSPIRARAHDRRALIESGAQALHDVRQRWQAASDEVGQVTQGLEKASTIWAQGPLSESSYRELDARLGSLEPHILSVMMAQKETRGRRDIRRHGPTFGRRLLAAGGLMGAASFVALLIAVGRPSTALVAIGWAGLLMSVVSIAFGWRVFRPGPRGLTELGTSPRAHGSDPGEYGFDSIESLESAYLEFLSARPAYLQLVEVRALAEKKRAHLEATEREVRAAFGLRAEVVLDIRVLESMEQEAQDLADRLRELERQELDRDRLAEEARRASDLLGESEERLRAALSEAGLSDGDLAQDAARFYDLCANRRTLERLEAERRALDAELDSYTAKEGEVRNATNAHRSNEKDLLRILRQVGVVEGDPEQAFQEFGRRCDQAEERREQSRRLDSLIRERDALIGNQSPEELRAQLEALSGQGSALLGAHPWLEGVTSPAPLAALQRELDECRGKLADANGDLRAAEERIARTGVGQRPLPEIEEEIRATQESVAALEAHGRALRLAMQELDAAADEHHRNFLPRLNETVGRNLGRLTGGRYESVQIDHADLQVRLAVNGLPNPVTPEVLSRGAQEQIYLLLRLGLTELMSRGRERLPLVLDDSLVNYDHDRLIRGLDFLADVAAETQVLLFTKDEETARWLNESRREDGRHALHFIHTGERRGDGRV